MLDSSTCAFYFVEINSICLIVTKNANMNIKRNLCLSFCSLSNWQLYNDHKIYYVCSSDTSEHSFPHNSKMFQFRPFPSNYAECRIRRCGFFLLVKIFSFGIVLKLLIMHGFETCTTKVKTKLTGISPENLLVTFLETPVASDDAVSGSASGFICQKETFQLTRFRAISLLVWMSPDVRKKILVDQAGFLFPPQKPSCPRRLGVSPWRNEMNCSAFWVANRFIHTFCSKNVFIEKGSMHESTIAHFSQLRCLHSLQQLLRHPLCNTTLPDSNSCLTLIRSFGDHSNQTSSLVTKSTSA